MRGPQGDNRVLHAVGALSLAPKQLRITPSQASADNHHVGAGRPGGRGGVGGRGCRSGCFAERLERRATQPPWLVPRLAGARPQPLEIPSQQPPLTWVFAPASLSVRLGFQRLRGARLGVTRLVHHRADVAAMGSAVPGGSKRPSHPEPSPPHHRLELCLSKSSPFLDASCVPWMERASPPIRLAS